MVVDMLSLEAVARQICFFSDDIRIMMEFGHSLIVVKEVS